MNIVKNLLVATAILTATTAVTHAARIVSFTPVATDNTFKYPSSPDFTFLGGNPMESGSSGFGMTKNNRMAAQTLTITTTGTLTHFTFSAEKSLSAGEISKTVKFEIYRVRAVDDLTPIGGIHETFTISSDTQGWGPGGSGTYLVDIANTTVTAGEIWAVKSTAYDHPYDKTKGAGLFVWDAGLPPYNDGQLVTNDQFNPGAISVAFYDDIPEPSYIAFLCLGLAGVVVINRRSRTA